MFDGRVAVASSTRHSGGVVVAPPMRLMLPTDASMPDVLVMGPVMVLLHAYKKQGQKADAYWKTMTSVTQLSGCRSSHARFSALTAFAGVTPPRMRVTTPSTKSVASRSG